MAEGVHDVLRSGGVDEQQGCRCSDQRSYRDGREPKGLDRNDFQAIPSSLPKFFVGRDATAAGEPRGVLADIIVWGGHLAVVSLQFDEVPASSAAASTTPANHPLHSVVTV